MKARVGHAEIHPDGSGWIEVDYSRHHTPAQRIAVSLAGGMAEGVGMGSRQCRGDQRNIDAELRRVPSKDRPAVMAEAKRLARTGRSRESGTAKRISRSLQQRGTYK